MYKIGTHTHTRSALIYELARLTYNCNNLLPHRPMYKRSGAVNSSSSFSSVFYSVHLTCTTSTSYSTPKPVFCALQTRHLP